MRRALIAIAALLAMVLLVPWPEGSAMGQLRASVANVFAQPGVWLSISAPLILAAMGGFTSERTGVINIALEGKMLTAACAAYLATIFTHNPWAALGFALAAATAMSLLHWVLTQTYQLDHVISGMAINAIALGATNYMSGKYADQGATELPVLPSFTAGSIKGIPITVSILSLLALLIPVALFLFARFSRGGLRMFAVGNDPDKSRLMGVQPSRVRLSGLIATGIFTGLAGDMLFSSAGQFTNEMTAGKGFIALAALILGGWKPLPAFGACMAFGFFQALQLHLQGMKIAGADLPAEAFSSLPYLVTIIALAGLLGRSNAPAALGKP